MNNIKESLKSILSELEMFSTDFQNPKFDKITSVLMQSKRLFLCGKGRSGLMVSAFANRLLHLGFNSHLIGEVSTPACKENDVLIIASGSGETSSLVTLAKQAKELKMKIILFTMNKDCSIAKYADDVIVIPGVSPKVNNNLHSIQPMGSSFEQLLLIVFDSFVLNLMSELNLDSQQMFKNHANLE